MSPKMLHKIDLHRPVGVVVKHIGEGAGGLGFNSQGNHIGQCRQRFTTAATFPCCPGAKLQMSPDTR